VLVTYRVLKKRLQALSVRNTDQWAKKPQSTSVEETVAAEIWVPFVLSLQQMLCVVSTHVNTTFSSSSHKKCVPYQKFLISLESPDKNSQLVAVAPLSHWPALNTPKSLGVRALSHGTWIRLSVESGLDVEAQPTGPPSHLTLILCIFGCGDT
jgi:hypothetical protein